MIPDIGQNVNGEFSPGLISPVGLPGALPPIGIKRPVPARLIHRPVNASTIRKGDRTMLLEKKRLSVEDLEAQAALELPDREMLALIRIGNIVTHDFIDVNVQNVNVAVQVCAIVEAISVELLTVDALSCRIVQR